MRGDVDRDLVGDQRGGCTSSTPPRSGRRGRGCRSCLASSSRTANSSATDSPSRRRAANWRAAAEASSSQWASSTTARTGRSAAHGREEVERRQEDQVTVPRRRRCRREARGGRRLGRRDGVEAVDDRPQEPVSAANGSGARTRPAGPQDDEVLGVCHGLREGRLADPRLAAHEQRGPVTPAGLGPRRLPSRSCSCSPRSTLWTPSAGPTCRVRTWRPGPSSNVGTPDRNVNSSQRRNSRLERRNSTQPPELPTRPSVRRAPSSRAARGGRGGRCGPPARWHSPRGCRRRRADRADARDPGDLPATTAAPFSLAGSRSRSTTVPTKVPASPHHRGCSRRRLAPHGSRWSPPVAVRPAWYGQGRPAGPVPETAPEGLGLGGVRGPRSGTQGRDLRASSATKVHQEGRAATDAAALVVGVGPGGDPRGRWAVRPAAQHVDDGDETGPPKTPSTIFRSGGRSGGPFPSRSAASPAPGSAPGHPARVPGSASRSRWRAGRSPVPSADAAGGWSAVGHGSSLGVLGCWLR